MTEGHTQTDMGQEVDIGEMTFLGNCWGVICMIKTGNNCSAYLGRWMCPDLPVLRKTIVLFVCPPEQMGHISRHPDIQGHELHFLCLMTFFFSDFSADMFIRVGYYKHTQKFPLLVTWEPLEDRIARTHPEPAQTCSSSFNPDQYRKVVRGYCALEGAACLLRKRLCHQPILNASTRVNQTQFSSAHSEGRSISSLPF